MTNKDIIVVTSPTQLVCAIEWKNKNPNSIIVVRHTAKKSINQIKNLQKLFNTQVISTKGFNNIQNLTALMTISLLLLKNSGKLVIGDYHYSRFNQLLCKLFNSKEKFLIDDGFATITFQEKIASAKKNINLFSFFNFKKRKYKNQIILKNKMSILKRGRKINNSKAIFIGTDEESKDWVGGPEEYLNHIKHVAALPYIKKLYYVPKTHGHAFSAEMHSQIEQIKNVEILNCDYPIEVQLSLNKNYFEYGFSHMSTALFSLAELDYIRTPVFITSKKIRNHAFIKYVHSSAKKYLFDVKFEQASD